MATSKLWPGRIIDSDIDPDSPWNTSIVTQFRDSITNLADRVGIPDTDGGPYDPDIENHDHDGANSKAIALTTSAFSSLIIQKDVNTFPSLQFTLATGALGFDPVMLVLLYEVAGDSPTDAEGFSGMGVAFGTTSEGGIAFNSEGGTMGAYNKGYSDSNIMAFDNNVWGDATPAITADVTVWGSGGITVASNVNFPSTGNGCHPYLIFCIWGV